jgi:hypothetical protein
MFVIGLIGIFIGVIDPFLKQRSPVFLCFPLAACSFPFFVLSFPYMFFGARAVPHLGEPQTLKSWRLQYWIPLSLLGVLMALFVQWHYGR